MIKIKEKTYDEQQYIGLMNDVNKVKRKIAIATGVGLVVVGVATLPVPCGSIQMITAGTMLIFVPNTSIKKMYNQMKWHIKIKVKVRKNK